MGNLWELENLNGYIKSCVLSLLFRGLQQSDAVYTNLGNSPVWNIRFVDLNKYRYRNVWICYIFADQQVKSEMGCLDKQCADLNAQGLRSFTQL